MPNQVKKGIYRHYKGKEYQVLFVATHSESEEPLVIYQTLYGNYDHWARPLNMFTEDVIVDGKTQPRFQFVRDE
ncbi:MULTISPECIES: DUF1653 domain-containing protein [Pseudoalteromonas]|uniref:DUF1653 domain-containing protein n=1 Tax=Pseudoalteromonas luteoviolacea (strain 2ta16) TaxID=1353533 RepID=V4HQ50_PSEL2|nr:MULTISPECIES: DUF1653 domain-containing protein [Pseudoalteromonas]ESP92940.1 protein of unknown function (DUF1653) [Pseudoalteromonas luteoviolacea 2ta16]KZN43246.1 hypothetical protein N483_10020 [Pseudoalteromonas luteoviolacea NCIMB 1944]MCG7549377.1 DUF1653 domain-containing protein [Pseudoalteromonas sp. Of7M-16]